MSRDDGGAVPSPQALQSLHTNRSALQWNAGLLKDIPIAGPVRTRPNCGRVANISAVAALALFLRPAAKACCFGQGQHGTVKRQHPWLDACGTSSAEWHRRQPLGLACITPARRMTELHWTEIHLRTCDSPPLLTRAVVGWTVSAREPHGTTYMCQGSQAPLYPFTVVNRTVQHMSEGIYIFVTIMELRRWARAQSGILPRHPPPPRHPTLA